MEGHLNSSACRTRIHPDFDGTPLSRAIAKLRQIECSDRRLGGVCPNELVFRQLLRTPDPNTVRVIQGVSTRSDAVKDIHLVLTVGLIRHLPRRTLRASCGPLDQIELSASAPRFERVLHVSRRAAGESLYLEVVLRIDVQAIDVQGV